MLSRFCFILTSLEQIDYIIPLSKENNINRSLHCRRFKVYSLNQRLMKRKTIDTVNKRSRAALNVNQDDASITLGDTKRVYIIGKRQLRV